MSRPASDPYPGRDLIVFVTFAVILLTLIGQGLTLPALVRRLGVGGIVGRVEDHEIAARLRLARAALHELDHVAAGTMAPPEAVERVRGHYAERIERLERRHAMLAASGAEQADDARTHAATRLLIAELTDIERSELQRLQNDGVVDSSLARRLQQALDLQPIGRRAPRPEKVSPTG